MKKTSETERLGAKIKDCLEQVKIKEGWTVDDLAYYLEINSMTLRNSLSRCLWSDMIVTILKLKNAIPESLAQEYKQALERERIDRRKKK
jgi:hypothetical protein